MGVFFHSLTNWVINGIALTHIISWKTEFIIQLIENIARVRLGTSKIYSRIPRFVTQFSKTLYFILCQFFSLIYVLNSLDNKSLKARQNTA